MTTPGLSHRETSLLLVVDVQQRLMPAIAGGEEVIRRCRCLTAIARAVAVPVWATEHYPERIGTLVAELRDHVDSIFAKRHFNAMGEANLAEAMAGRPGEVIVTGAETHVCVYQTVMGLLQAGQPVTVCVDATGSHGALDREIALEEMQRRGVRLATVEQLAFEWLETGDHPAFRQVLDLIKAHRQPAP